MHFATAGRGPRVAGRRRSIASRAPCAMHNVQCALGRGEERGELRSYRDALLPQSRTTLAAARSAADGSPAKQQLQPPPHLKPALAYTPQPASPARHARLRAAGNVVYLPGAPPCRRVLVSLCAIWGLTVDHCTPR